MLKSKWTMFMLAMLLVAALGFMAVGCETEEEVEPEDPEENGEEPEEPEEPEEKGEVDIVMVDWACATASSYVAAAVLEDMGYDVDITSVEAGVMYSSLATGDNDVAVCNWMPITHESHMEEFGEDIETVATQYEGARLGLAVPTYMEDLDSIEELDEFVDEIEGIDSGAGVMEAAERAIETYDLDVDLQVGSDATMVSELGTAYDNDEPIAVTGWAPHWKLGEWDLKFLEDPELEFGEEEVINNVARDDLAEDMPEVHAFFENFSWGDDEIGEVMEMNEEDTDFEANAQQWIDENQDIVEQWIP